MSFSGQRLLIQVDSQLREAFNEKISIHFGRRSIILTSDLSQFPPIRDNPTYAGKKIGNVL